MENCKNGAIEKHQNGSKPHECLDCIDWLNWAALMILPRCDNSVESNQQVAINYATKMISQMDLQEVFYAMKRHEAIAAQFSVIYNERTLKGRVADPKELERRADDWKRAEKEMKDRNRPKAEKKMLSDYEKAIIQLTNVGVSEPDAISIVKERFAKQGKVTQ